MVWALLAVSGVLIGLIAGALCVLVRARRSIRTIPDSLPCKVRVTTGSVPGFTAQWPRTRSHAVWVRDVLVVHTGFALERTHLLPSRSAARDIEDRDVPKLKPHGQKTAVLALVLDDGTAIEVAAPAAARALLPGPFLLAEGRPPGTTAASRPTDAGH
jgi:hypothetical protein